MPKRSPLLYVLLAAVLLAGVVTVWQAWRSLPTSGAPGQDGWVSTQWGPLGPADRDLLVRVRLAGLWEHPTGQELAERGTQVQVRGAAKKISDEHLELDRITVDTARQLGVLLPNQPTPEQQAWMREITAATGANYDWMAVNILRQAHGAVLPTIINVRVGTRNDLVREFAETAAAFVQRHIGYLESTGLVDFTRLDEPPSPPRAVVTRAGQYENVPIALVAMSALVILAGLTALVSRLLINRPQTEGRRRAGPAHQRSTGASS